MQLIQTISMDLAFRGITPRIYGKQDDSGAMRGVRIELFNAGAAYAISSGTTFLLRYKTAQGSIGLYDALPDGTAAFSFVAGENTVTATFVDQMFAQPGDVECELRIVDPAGVATTWTWILDVERGSVGDSFVPSDYINAFNILAASAAESADRAVAAASSLSVTDLGTAVAVNITGDATSVDLSSQICKKYGRIGFMKFFMSVGGHNSGGMFEFNISGVPDVLVAVASSAVYTTNGTPAFVYAHALFDSDNGAPIHVRVKPESGAAPSGSYATRFTIVCLLAE